MGINNVSIRYTTREGTQREAVLPINDDIQVDQLSDALVAVAIRACDEIAMLKRDLQNLGAALLPVFEGIQNQEAEAEAEAEDAPAEERTDTTEGFASDEAEDAEAGKENV